MRARHIAAGLLLAAGAFEASAEEVNQAQVTMPAITVTGTASLTVPSIKDAEEQINKTPGGVEVVPASRYLDGRATTMKDMLDYTPGVWIQSKYGQEDSKLVIRGSGLSRNFHLRGVRLLQDGSPINQADGSGDFHEIDPLAQQYIEVYKGANALRYGAMTLGGAINFVSPTGRSNPGLAARVYGGSYQTFGQQAAAGFGEGPWDAWLSFTNLSGNGFREHTNQSLQRLNGNVGAQIGSNVETRFFFSGNQVRNQIPGSLTQQQFWTDPRQGPLANVLQNTRRDIDSFRFANTTVVDVGDDAFTLQSYVKSKSLFHPLTFAVIDNNLLDWGVTGQYKGSRQLFGHRNDFIVGANYFGGTNRNRQFVNRFGMPGPLTNDNTEFSSSVEIYGENWFYATPELSIVTGIQFNWANRVLTDNYLVNGNDSGAASYFEINPKIGALWEPRPGLQFFANVSRASEPPTWSELNPSFAPGFAPLAPQTSWTAEIGTRGKLGENVGWDLSLYRSWVKNELQLLVVPGFGGSAIAINIPNAIHQGIELGLNGTAWRSERNDRITGRMALTVSDYRFDNNPTYGNNQLPGAPPYYLRAEARYDSPGGFYIGPNLEWSPQGYYVDNLNNTAFMTAPYALLGLKAGYTGLKGFEFFVDARNLTNQMYVSNVGVTSTANATSQLYNPGDGASVYAGIQARF
ncbi:TonB-dependent receptor [Reyranella sp. MMS21-HV4-11]|uniref:TonB-dependent receptor n=1 Tax=Reyranella humidisoli TaxID=2849149 RepID=A0ABS6IJD8_9HYPH|nr:TonB-dependent receptor [Reyranella sp. MMS21-HV4-11]MBU8874719.1 TonB-dependent receptor [Reyranella sp. MMS21-HV4-11]